MRAIKKYVTEQTHPNDRKFWVNYPPINSEPLIHRQTEASSKEFITFPPSGHHPRWLVSRVSMTFFFRPRMQDRLDNVLQPRTLPHDLVAPRAAPLISRRSACVGSSAIQTSGKKPLAWYAGPGPDCRTLGFSPR